MKILSDGMKEAMAKVLMSKDEIKLAENKPKKKKRKKTVFTKRFDRADDYLKKINERSL